MIFLCSLDSSQSTHRLEGEDLRSACIDFGESLRRAGYLLASYAGGTLGRLERRPLGEINFTALITEVEAFPSWWLIEVRDLNHAIAIFDAYPMLTSVGVKIRALVSEGDWQSSRFGSILNPDDFSKL